MEALRHSKKSQRKPLTLEDAKAIQASCPAVRSVTTFLQTEWDHPHTIRTKSGSVSAIDFRGVQANFGLVYANAATLEGRFISEGDDLHKEKVVMLGENVAPVLFPEGHPIGKEVMIDGSDFQVIGVVEKPKGGFGMGDEDRRVLIPFNTFRKVFPSADEINMRAQAYPKKLDDAVDQIREVLERRRGVPYGGKDNFSIATAEQEVAGVSQDHADGVRGDGRAEFHGTADRRRRGHEHHAGECDRANARNWRPQGHRSQE